MNRTAAVEACYGLLVLIPALACATSAPAPPPEPSAQVVPRSVVPPSPPPGEVPPPPPSAAEPLPPEALPPPTAAVPAGQWVYTLQYGWIWQPYGDAYVWVPRGGFGEPLTYVFYPAYGWAWVVSPWVWGLGPWPYFGIGGPSLFAWYGHGWWRTPSRWHYRPAPARGGVASRGIRPAPVRRHARPPPARPRPRRR